MKNTPDNIDENDPRAPWNDNDDDSVIGEMTLFPWLEEEDDDDKDPFDEEAYDD